MIMWWKEKQWHLISDSGAWYLRVALFSDMQTGSFAWRDIRSLGICSSQTDALSENATFHTQTYQSVQSL